MTKQKDKDPPFEIVLIVRDANGNPTGTKTEGFYSGYKLNEFFERNSVKPVKKYKAKANVAPKEVFVDKTERVVPDTSPKNQAEAEDKVFDQYMGEK